MPDLLKNSLRMLTALCVVAACSRPATVCHSYQPLPASGWTTMDTLVFPVAVPDSLPPRLRCFVEVRNRLDYPYSDLYVAIAHNLADSATFRTDTLRIQLADEHGRWTGEGWESTFVTEQFVSTVQPPRGGRYTVKVALLMPDRPLKGLHDIGIRIERDEQMPRPDIRHK